MKIDHQTRLADIQDAFSKQFSHLRLEFYKKPHEAGEGSADREKLNRTRALSEVTKSPRMHELHFDSKMQISGLESMLEKEFGLYAQVFRRSGNLWLQTTATDGWTLDQANSKGRHSEELSKEEQETEPEPPGPETE
ncbi:MAG TPA: hypothetical protein VI603_05555 [Saprospiraceae bacterium]|nr:hypothetical protein [Saprospiraceae bacterium]